MLEGTGEPPAPPDRTGEAVEQATLLLAEGLTRREVVRRISETLGLPPQRRLSAGDGAALMLRARCSRCSCPVAASGAGARAAPGDDDRPAALRWRRRLVRQPVQPAQSAHRDPHPHRPARGGRGEGRHAVRGRALERALHLHDGARQRALERPRSGDAPPLPAAGRLSPRRRQLRHGRVDPARAGAALSRSTRWSKCRSTTRSITWCTTSPRAFPRSTSTTASPRRASASFSTAGWPVYYSYQSDLGDGWEDFEVHRDPPEKHEAALRMGVNLFAYAVGYGG